MSRPRLYLRVLDAVMVPLLVIPLLMLRFFRRKGTARMPLLRALCMRLGVLPIRNHYYDPYIDPEQFTQPLSAERPLPGIDLGEAGQLALLRKLDFTKELAELPRAKTTRDRYYLDNSTFGAGDGELFYSLLRHLKPRRLVEVGCGLSTLVAEEALRKNRAEDAPCHHLCIEPYEEPFFVSDDLELLRSRSQEAPLEVFERLDAGDVLFLDTTHVLRPQGDVLHAFQRILPVLKPGVYVHVHDVFTPFDYPDVWIREDLRMWDEQYLLEAFLAFNPRFEVVAAVHYLKERHLEALLAVCPALRELDGTPSSFWMRTRAA